MEGYEALIAGLIGVVLGSILAFLKDYIFESRKKKKELQYLSLIVAMLLDKFVEGCAEVVRDDGYPDERGCLDPMVLHPKIDFTVIDVNWMSLPAGLMHDVLSFPAQVDDSNAYINGVTEYQAGPPDYEEFFFARKIQYSGLGIKAIDLATKLRFHAGFPQTIECEYSSRNFFMKSKEVTEAALKKYEANHNQMYLDATTET